MVSLKGTVVLTPAGVEEMIGIESMLLIGVLETMPVPPEGMMLEEVAFDEVYRGVLRVPVT